MAWGRQQEILQHADGSFYCLPSHSPRSLIDSKKPHSMRPLFEEWDHMQCQLVSQNGTIAIWRPTTRKVPQSVNPGWLASGLDNISSDVYKPELRPRLHDTFGPWRRKQTGPARRRYLSQTRLCFDGSRLVCRKPILSPRNLGPSQRLAFLQLPYEIRQEVYRELLISENEIVDLLNFSSGERPWCALSNGTKRCRAGISLKPKVWPEILATCSLIHNEAHLTLYREHTFRPRYINFRIGQKWPLARDRYISISPSDIGSVQRVRLDSAYDGFGYGFKGNDLPVFQDFQGLRDLQFHFNVGWIDGEIEAFYRGIGLHIYLKSKAQHQLLMSTFLKAMQCAQIHASRLRTFSCRLGLGWDMYAFIVEGTENLKMKADEERAEKYDPDDWLFECYRDNKLSILDELRKEGVLQEREMEWTFYLEHGEHINCDFEVDGYIEFGWGGRSWPRSENGRKMVRCDKLRLGDGEDGFMSGWKDDTPPLLSGDN